MPNNPAIKGTQVIGRGFSFSICESRIDYLNLRKLGWHEIDRTFYPFVKGPSDISPRLAADRFYVA